MEMKDYEEKVVPKLTELHEVYGICAPICMQIIRPIVQAAILVRPSSIPPTCDVFILICFSVYIVCRFGCAGAGTRRQRRSREEAEGYARCQTGPYRLDVSDCVSYGW